jgi:hypothetical protein
MDEQLKQAGIDILMRCFHSSIPKFARMDRGDIRHGTHFDVRLNPMTLIKITSAELYSLNKEIENRVNFAIHEAITEILMSDFEFVKIADYQEIVDKIRFYDKRFCLTSAYFSSIVQDSYGFTVSPNYAREGHFNMYGVIRNTELYYDDYMYREGWLVMFDRMRIFPEGIDVFIGRENVSFRIDMSIGLDGLEAIWCDQGDMPQHLKERMRENKLKEIGI